MSATIHWWQPREPSPVHLGLIHQGLKRHAYFRGAKLVVRTDKEEPVGTVRVDGDDSWEIQPSQFLLLVQDVLD